MAARELTAENHRKRVLRRMAMRAIKKHTKLA